ncbi:NAD(+)/NADH kinase [Desulfobotulus sp. H1]|uniref:NAD kinase n=1 Tax=Desulfobotulus pelophilus TaxID=2823377 RepID=A0ABT3NBV2_9BACT|nr:NAD(+)/NADH kinase [Desulfobotulus pelophilus]MCW7754947.1 NAD(+)/NADH kinase [Desulfobotulus pelophilus]
MAATVGLIVKEDEQAQKTADAFSVWLANRGLKVVRHSASGEEVLSYCGAPSEVEVVFALGGDGTFLSAARWIGNRGVPLLGVKFGEVGFLAEVVEDRLYEIADAVLEGYYTAEERMCLRVSLHRGGQVLLEERVLNDVVISKGALARLARVRTEIDGRYLTTYTGDGLIIATPTGSTAYSMAAGGPVVHPFLKAILLTPICPFTLTNRPLILPDGVRVTVRLDPRSSEDIMLTCDGQSGHALQHGDSLSVVRAEIPVRMITLPDQRYFDVLKAKLRWSGERI